MNTFVDIHAPNITPESILDELRLHPWRLEEEKKLRARHNDDGGNTPLLSAVTSRNVPAVVLLLSLGSNVEAKNAV